MFKSSFCRFICIFYINRTILALLFCDLIFYSTKFMPRSLCWHISINVMLFSDSTVAHQSPAGKHFHFFHITIFCNYQQGYNKHFDVKLWEAAGRRAWGLILDLSLNFRPELIGFMISGISPYFSDQRHGMVLGVEEVLRKKYLPVHKKDTWHSCPFLPLTPILSKRLPKSCPKLCLPWAAPQSKGALIVLCPKNKKMRTQDTSSPITRGSSWKPGWMEIWGPCMSFPVPACCFLLPEASRWAGRFFLSSRNHVLEECGEG